MGLEKIAKKGNFEFIVSVFPTLDGESCQAIISNDKILWTKKVGLETDSFKEAEDELRYYLKHGFNFGGVQYKPNAKRVMAQ